ncbi:hypothetical protein OPV22_013259 [Ensete ventricosum]|uniref:Uncharacterized protein n=1 Tax=Ensete ventricosum TaxID=4639 RepID=A0AAV8R0M6_ENSVE|nr:hypothetical protein OPV22_013259 [Ensete ventricosum]
MALLPPPLSLSPPRSFCRRLLSSCSFPSHCSNSLFERRSVTVCASSDPDGKDGIEPEAAAPSEGSREAVSVENLPLESEAANETRAEAEDEACQEATASAEEALAQAEDEEEGAMAAFHDEEEAHERLILVGVPLQAIYTASRSWDSQGLA